MALKYRSTAVFLKPDVRYKSTLVSKFINCLMKGGQKSTAERWSGGETHRSPSRFTFPGIPWCVSSPLPVSYTHLTLPTN